MRHILVKYCSNWADEFDIQGFAIMNEEEYIQWIEDFRKAEKTDQVWYFGTNEYICYWDFKKDWSVINLSMEEALNLVYIFGLGQESYEEGYPTYGFFPVFHFEEEEEEEND